MGKSGLAACSVSEYTSACSLFLLLLVSVYSLVQAVSIARNVVCIKRPDSATVITILTDGIQPVHLLTVDNRHKCLWTVNNSGIIHYNRYWI